MTVMDKINYDMTFPSQIWDAWKVQETFSGRKKEECVHVGERERERETAERSKDRYQCREEKDNSQREKRKVL